MRVRVGPSVVRTLPGASEVGSEALQSAHSPRGLSQHHRSAGWLGGEEAGAAAAGEIPKLPLSVSLFHFFFLGNLHIQSCLSIQ